MGLLLGGSAITLFELLDLIIYNVIHKLKNRNKAPPSAESPIHEDNGLELEMNPVAGLAMV